MTEVDVRTEESVVDEDADEDEETLVGDINRINEALGIEGPWTSHHEYRRTHEDDGDETSDSEGSNDEDDVQRFASASGFLDSADDQHAAGTSGFDVIGEASTIGGYDLSQDIRELEAAQSESTLENCLYLNQMYQEAISSVIGDLEVLLMNNKEMQIVTQDELNLIVSEGKFGIGSLFSVRKMRIPYFKQGNGMMPPTNEDTRIKAANQELSPLMRLRRLWSTHEFSILEKAVEGTALELAIQPIMARKEILWEELEEKNLSADDMQAKRTECKEKDDQLKAITSQNSSSFVSESRDKDYDWMKISAVDFDGLRAPRECELYWKNYVHPSISKKKWTKDELAKLEVLVNTHGPNNWDLVAQELQTNRIAVQCAEKHHSSANHRIGAWTIGEKVELLNVVEVCRIGDYIPFHLVSNMIEGRPPKEIWRQWTYFLDPSVRRGKWTLEEDTMLLTAVWLLGAKNWFQIKNFVNTRNDIQCCERWQNTLDPSLKIREFTPTEDQTLIELVNVHGKKWTVIGKKLRRTDNRCANRYKRLMTFKEKHPDGKSSLGTVPRRELDLYRRQLYRNVANRLTEISEEIGSSLKRPKLRRNFRALTRDTCKMSAGEIKLGEHLKKYRIENLVATMMQKPQPIVRKVTRVERGFQEFFKLSSKRRHRGRPPKIHAIEDDDEVYEDAVVKFQELLFDCDGSLSVGPNRIPILPPMTNTMQAFRNILLMRTRLGSANGGPSRPKTANREGVEDIVTSKGTEESGDAVAAGISYDELFGQFASLFAWPALLSAIKPCDEPQKPRKDRRRRGPKRKVGEVKDDVFKCFAKPTGEFYTAAAKDGVIKDEPEAKRKKGRPLKTAQPKPPTEPTRRSSRTRNTDT